MIYLILGLAFFIIFLFINSATYSEFKNHLIKIFFVAAGFVSFYFLIRVAPAFIAAISGVLVAVMPMAFRVLFSSASFLSILRGFLPNILSRRRPPEAMSPEEAREILGVKMGDSKEKINKSYREKMKKFHPDHGGKGEMSYKINEAKRILIKEFENANK
jgi:hypothetical protein